MGPKAVGMCSKGSVPVCVLLLKQVGLARRLAHLTSRTPPYQSPPASFLQRPALLRHCRRCTSRPRAGGAACGWGTALPAGHWASTSATARDVRQPRLRLRASLTAESAERHDHYKSRHSHHFVMR